MLRTIEFLCVGLWLGGGVFLSFVVAPGAFSVLSSRDAAGAIVGYSLTRMHIGGILCGIVFLLVRLVRSFSASASGFNAPGISFASPAIACVVLMIAVTTISQAFVTPRMAALRLQMGSIQSTPAGNPLLAAFGRLHRISISLESLVLLGGLATLYLLVRESPQS
jgi:uncharacterized membrane protein